MRREPTTSRSESGQVVTQPKGFSCLSWRSSSYLNYKPLNAHRCYSDKRPLDCTYGDIPVELSCIEFVGILRRILCVGYLSYYAVFHLLLLLLLVEMIVDLVVIVGMQLAE